MPSPFAVARLLLLALLGPALGATSVAASPCGASTRPLDAPIALVLSGGGAKGAYEAGVAAVLVERGLAIRLVAGSSAGALNAAMIVDGRLDRLEALWRGLSRDRVYSLRARVLFAGLLPGWLTLLDPRPRGLALRPEPLRELIDASLDLDGHPRLAGAAPRGHDRPGIAASRGSSTTGPLTREALMAAAAVPGAFPAVDVGGALLVDGGLTGRAPVLEALAAGTGSGAGGGGDELRAGGARRAAHHDAARARGSLRDGDDPPDPAGRGAGALKFPGVEVHLLQPSAPLALRPLEFDQEGIARALERGRADAVACLSGWAKR